MKQQNCSSAVSSSPLGRLSATTLCLLAAAAATLACSSDPESPAVGGAGTAGTSTGTSGSSTGGGGSAAVGGSPSGGSPSGASSSGGSSGGTQTSGGSGGGAGAGGSGGSTVGGGGSGSGGASTGGGGSGGGTPVDPGNLPNMIPQGYTGTPFGGTPQTIPGKIEIEKYDLGGANVAFKAEPQGGAFNKCGFTRADALKLQCTQQAGSPADKSLPGCGVEPAGQIYLGYINAGDWYKYTVNVVEAGTYVISGHEGVAGNTQMQFTFTDAVKTANLTLPGTDMCNFEAYHVWATHPTLGEITLQPGKYVLTINVVAAAMNLDWFAFTKK